MVIKPTVGRVVWFFCAVTDPIYARGQPLAAIVCHVHNDRLVNLDVIDHNGQHHVKTAVRLWQEGDIMQDDDYCRWPDRN